jgi:hypothetical protein
MVQTYTQNGLWDKILLYCMHFGVDPSHHIETNAAASISMMPILSVRQCLWTAKILPNIKRHFVSWLHGLKGLCHDKWFILDRSRILYNFTLFFPIEKPTSFITVLRQYFLNKYEEHLKNSDNTTLFWKKSSQHVQKSPNHSHDTVPF